jgi:hypothetical protein
MSALIVSSVYVVVCERGNAHALTQDKAWARCVCVLPLPTQRKACAYALNGREAFLGKTGAGVKRKRQVVARAW